MRGTRNRRLALRSFREAVALRLEWFDLTLPQTSTFPSVLVTVDNGVSDASITYLWIESQLSIFFISMLVVGCWLFNIF